MATCKDCIHFDVCKDATIPNPEYKGPVADKSKECRHFKNKADFVEVKHGEWRKSQFSGRSGFYSVRDVICSECGIYSTFLQHEIRPDYYCPNCGAKMDGGNK